MGLSKHSTLLLPLIPMPPRLYSYIVARDYGFAPNPFYSFCTLATCMPGIRERAAQGDWIVGTGSKRNGKSGCIVYAMRVSEAMSFDRYWQDPRFREKRPDLHGSLKQAFGDNIYHRDAHTGQWLQTDSHHSLERGKHNQANIDHDTKSNRVLIGEDFVYWGGNGPEIPLFRGKNICHTGRNYLCNFTEAVVQDFVNWIRDLNSQGCVGDPLDWK